VCLHFLCNFCLKYLSFEEEFGEILKTYTGLHVYYLLFLSDFNEAWVLSTDFRKLLKYLISWKSARWKLSCSVRKDRHDEANYRLSQICERARNCVAKQHTTITHPYLCVCIPSLQIKPCFTSHEQDHTDVLRHRETTSAHMFQRFGAPRVSHSLLCPKMEAQTALPPPETLAPIYQN
jgi:hypothetical protein